MAKERVRMSKETRTEQQEVSGEVRKEHIETDTDTGTGIDAGGHTGREGGQTPKR